MANPNITSNIRIISHQGFFPANRWRGRCLLSSYLRSAEQGYQWVETDIKFTADCIPVCTHDHAFTDSNDGQTRVEIAAHTLAQLKSHGYHGEVIATFDEVLHLCKTHGLGLYIDHLSQWDDERWDALFSTVHKYKMEDRVAWLTNQPMVIERILAWDPTAEISLVTGEQDLTPLIELAKAYQTLQNTVAINALYTKVSVEEAQRVNQLLCGSTRFELWTIDDAESLSPYLPYISGFTTNKISPKELPCSVFSTSN